VLCTEVSELVDEPGPGRSIGVLVSSHVPEVQAGATLLAGAQREADAGSDPVRGRLADKSVHVTVDDGVDSSTLMTT
jgi:hypothetical protein